MRDHDAIDRRSLAMARRIVAKIDADPRLLEHAHRVCARWIEHGNVPAKEWMEILRRTWPEVRAILLDNSEESRRLRQNDPFCGILTPRERWEIYRRERAAVVESPSTSLFRHGIVRPDEVRQRLQELDREIADRVAARLRGLGF